MKIRRTKLRTLREEIVDEKVIEHYQEQGFFAVDNALEWIKDGEVIYSDFSKFELVKE